MKIVRRNYFILLILGLVFAAPGLSAYIFYTHTHWLGASKTNKGVFLEPPVLLASLSAEKPKWRLVLWSPAACEASCIAQLDKLARIRLALGRRLYEVAPQLLLGPHAPALSPELMSALRAQDIDTVVLSADAGMPMLQNHLEIFIANPANYLVLAYQPTVKPADIFNDIKLLLNTTDKMRK